MAALAGVRLAVKLVSKSSREGIDEVSFDAQGKISLRARVSAPPVEGKANEALIALLAKTLKVAKRDVSLTGGAASRMKMLFVAGDEATLRATLARLAERR